MSRLKSKPSDIRVETEVHGCSVNAVIDTAADVTVVSERFYHALRHPPKLTGRVNLRAAAEGQVFVAGITQEVCVKVGNVQIYSILFVAPIQDDMLLGIDILRKLQATIDLKKGTLTVRGNQILLQSQTEQNSDGFEVKLDRKIKCPPLTTTTVMIPVPREFQNADLDFEPNDNLPIFIPAAVFEHASEVPIQLTNPSRSSISLRKGTSLGNLSVLEPGSIEYSPILARVEYASEVCELPEKLIPLWNNVLQTATELSDAELSSLKHLLNEYSDVFADNDLDLGEFSAISHSIDTGEASPVKCGLRRTPIHFVQEEDKLLNEMLTAGVIRPSFSSWAAAPVFVRKRDGRTRWCLDYRKLNACTKKDVYPVPMMSECLDALDGNVWFSKLDANSAYWQIPVEEESKEKTAFRTRQGLFEFNKLPFGLCNAPSTYCRAINIVLTGLTWSKVLAFVDDVCVLGNSVEDHLNNLRLVFQRFRHYRLKLKPSKCNLFQKEIEFLGRKISADGMTLTDHSVATMEKWSPPNSVKEVERFLGLVNFHRMFIPNYSEVCEPLFRLLKKKEFIWTEEQQNAFLSLKEILASPAVLAVPSRKGKFILDTDASNVAIGAQLRQEQDGIERVIAYASFALTPCQRKYCTTRKELLAVVRFTNHFRHYLLGSEFLVRTDHHSLIWLMNFKKLEGQLARWHEELSRFAMTVQHRPGKQHQNADALSRIPVKEVVCRNYQHEIPLSELPCGGCKYCCRMHANWNSFESQVDDVVELISGDVKSVGLDVFAVRNINTHVNTSADQVAEMQQKDPELKFLHEWLTKNSSPSNEELKLSSKSTKFYWINRDMCILKGEVIYWKGQQQDFLIVPKGLKETILHLCHDLPSSGHQGIEGTKNRVKQRYFWHSLNSDVRKYVAGCKLCNINKHPNRKNRCPLTINQAGYPLEKVHIDFMGPFPKTVDGNEHLLVIVDSFTKWCEFIPLPSQEAEVTAWAVVKEFFLKFGCPLEIVSDQGRNFESALFREMCELFRVHKLRTTAYRPSANGQAERMNRTLLQALRCFVDKKQTNWDKCVPFIAAAMRSSVNSQTGFTPNRLMLGREVTMPAELIFPCESGLGSASQLIQDIQDQLQEAHEMARRTLKVKTKRMKRDYDLGVHRVSFLKGDVVYILDKAVHKGLSSKLCPVWTGPCLIVEVLTPYIFRVQINNRLTKVMNHDRLKKCQDKVIPKWMTKRQEELRTGAVSAYCFCGLPDDGRIMIQCDSCLEWYHGYCVGIDKAKAKTLKEYFCSRCIN